MIDIVKADLFTNLNYKFHLTEESDQLERANIQDQILALVMGWA